jgi:hypothetical protein
MFSNKASALKQCGCTVRVDIEVGGFIRRSLPTK